MFNKDKYILNTKHRLSTNHHYISYIHLYYNRISMKYHNFYILIHLSKNQPYKLNILSQFYLSMYGMVLSKLHIHYQYPKIHLYTSSEVLSIYFLHHIHMSSNIYHQNKFNMDICILCNHYFQDKTHQHILIIHLKYIKINQVHYIVSNFHDMVSMWFLLNKIYLGKLNTYQFQTKYMYHMEVCKYHIYLHDLIKDKGIYKLGD